VLATRKSFSVTLIDPLISRLGGQHHRDEQLKGRPEVELAGRIRISSLKLSKNLCSFLFIHTRQGVAQLELRANACGLFQLKPTPAV
jgi:hypothetical protein